MNQGTGAPPLVSVVMAVHNAGPDLARSVDSILRQTHRALEFLIVDDASADETAEILARYARADERVRVLRNERNIGLAASLNRALGEARGIYVARMDGDDASRPSRLERQVAFLEAHPEIAICGTAICKHMGGRGYTQRFPSSDAEIRATLLFHTAFAHPSVMWRRADFERLGLQYDASFLTTQDYDLWSRALGPLRGANLPAVLLDYYCHSGQVTAARYAQTLERTRQVHARVLAALVPEMTEEQASLHLRIALPHDAMSRAELEMAEKWLRELIAASDRIGLYDPGVLRRVISRRWAMLCGMAAGAGMETFSVYVKSPLARPRGSPGAAAKVFAKCVLKRPC